MKINIKKYRFMLILIGLFAFSLPVVAIQVDKDTDKVEMDVERKTKAGIKEERKAEIQEKQLTAFCDNISALESKMDEGVANRKNKLDKLRDDKLTKSRNRWNTRSQKLDEFKANRDGIREAHYERLLNLAKTDDQKKAVNDFKNAIEQAVSVRRAAIEAEQKSFFSQLDKLIKERWSGVDAALADLEAAQDKAFNEAGSVCQGGNSDVKTIRENLRNDLKSAREAYQASRKEVNNRDEISGIVKAHRDNVKQIIEDFKEAAKVAKNGLKAVFGDISDNVQVDE